MARRLPLHFPICRDLTSVGTPYKSQHTTGFRHPSALFTELFRTCVSSCSLLSINNWAVFLDSSARSDHVLVILQQHIENHARLGGHACWHACDFPTAAESSCRSQCGWQTTQVSMKCCARTADCLAPNFAKLKPDRGLYRQKQASQAFSGQAMFCEPCLSRPFQPWCCNNLGQG